MRKNIFLWALYDLANTPLTVAITGLYLAQWIVLDNNLPDIWYGGTFVLSTILLLFTSPFWGAWSDRQGQRMSFITWTTISIIFFGIILAIIATSSMATIPKVLIVLVLFFILQYAYQISLIFYDSLLVQISNPKNRGKISGIGRTFGELGWLLGPVILLPFANGLITLFGTPGRAQVFLPAIIFLILLGLPMIFWFKEPKPKQVIEKFSFKEINNKTISGLKNLIKKDRNSTIFLVAFMLVSDAILTSVLYFGIFLDQVYHLSDNQKVIMLVLLEIVAVASAYLVGRISDKYGTKTMVIFSCIILTIGFFLISISSSINILYLLVCLIGLGLGGFYPTTRTLLVNISPPNQIGEYFSFYAVFERFASIIGPLVWGTTTLILSNYGTDKYRVAMLLLSGLMIIGTVLFKNVREENHNIDYADN